jgi:PAS domain S-box-containing protein
LSIVPIKRGADIFFCGFLRDISERKKAEQKLIESENRLRTILNTEPECIKLLSSNGELLDMNPAGLEMIEADSLEQVKGQCVEMLIAPAYKKQFHQLTLDVFKGGSGRLEFEIIGLKGTRRWMATHAVPLKDAEGKITSLLSVTRDITERKKGEEDLLREKNLSDSIINSLPGIFYLSDEKGNFLRWNKNFEAVTGYNAAELSQLHPLDFFDGEEKEFVNEKIKEVFEKGMTELEAFAVVKSKEKIPFYFTGWRVIFEGKPCLIGVGIDVTKRKKAEMEMSVANERFSLIARATNDFVWDAYLDENKVWWNDNYYSQLGWKKGQQIPGRDSWENHIHKNDKKRVMERLAHILDHTNDSTWTDEYRFGKADGNYINVYDRGYIMRDDKKKAYRMIGAMTDISEMKNAEELLKHSYEDIRRLASHLEKIREEERITIAREIHDELGQQLTVLKMDISWIKKNIMPKEEKAKQRIIGLLQMIDLTIKTVRRISSELRPSVLDDLGLVAALEWLSGDFEKRSGIKTKFVTDTNDLNLDATTSTALFRIFQESLTNIARHAQASEVYASLKKENEKLLISIKDNGKGFVISSIANKKTLGILGIKERVALLQGKYEIISSPGQGSTVKVLVPVSSITEPKTSQ